MFFMFFVLYLFSSICSDFFFHSTIFQSFLSLPFFIFPISSLDTEPIPISLLHTSSTLQLFLYISCSSISILPHHVYTLRLYIVYTYLVYTFLISLRLKSVHYPPYFSHTLCLFLLSIFSHSYQPLFFSPSPSHRLSLFSVFIFYHFHPSLFFSFNLLFTDSPYSQLPFFYHFDPPLFFSLHPLLTLSLLSVSIFLSLSSTFLLFPPSPVHSQPRPTIDLSFPIRLPFQKCSLKP